MEGTTPAGDRGRIRKSFRIALGIRDIAAGAAAIGVGHCRVYGRRLAGLVRATPDSWSDVHAWVLANRWRYFFAILTLFKNYFQ